MRLGKDVIMPDNIKANILWYFENYWGVVNTIMNERNMVLYQTPITDFEIPIRSTKLSDPTMEKAVLLTKLDLDELIAWVKVVNETYRYYRENDAQKASLLWFTYFESNPRRKSKEKIAQQLFASKNAFYQWMDSICGIAGLIAAEKGLIKVNQRNNSAI